MWTDLLAMPGTGADEALDRFTVQERHKQRALQYFLKRAANYHRIVERGPLKLLRRRERNTVLELAGFSPRQTMLDVGCGRGFYAIEAKRRGMTVCALDVLPSMVAPLAPVVDEVVVGDIDDFTSTSRFDCIVCAGVLDFVLNPYQAFFNLCRLIAPGGRLVLLVPRRGPAGFVYRIEKLSFGIRINFFDVQWFQQMVTGTPFVVRRWEHPLPSNIALLLEHRGPATHRAAFKPRLVTTA